MARLHAQVAWHTYTLMPEDDCINTFSFESVSGTPESFADECQAAIGEFYLEIAPESSLAVYQMLAGDVLNGFATIKIYNIDDPEPRVPILQADVEQELVTTEPLPEEVAMCLSYHGAAVSGVPAARRRGRIYLGPLNSGVIDQPDDPGPVRPAEAQQECLRNAAARLAGSTEHLVSGTWGVWSRADDEIYTIVGGWTDNAFDTQRRRGQRPTIRTPWFAI